MGERFWKKQSRTFDPILTVIGIGFTLAGLYGIALLRNAFRHPVILIVAAIPLLDEAPQVQGRMSAVDRRQ